MTCLLFLELRNRNTLIYYLTPQYITRRYLHLLLGYLLYDDKLQCGHGSERGLAGPRQPRSRKDWLVIQVVVVRECDTEPDAVVITGPSESSIGAEVAKDLALANVKHIVLAGRNEAKIQPVIAAIRKANSAVKVDLVNLDLLDNSSVRKAAEEIKKLTSKIDTYIASAGIMANADFVKSKDGIESQLAANHIGHFLLTNLLMPEILAAGSTARVVIVASLGYQLSDMHFDD